MRRYHAEMGEASRRRVYHCSAGAHAHVCMPWEIPAARALVGCSTRCYLPLLEGVMVGVDETYAQRRLVTKTKVMADASRHGVSSAICC